MPLETITLPGRQSRARELHAVLRDAILNGTLTSGDRLVEEQIASIASVSRTPVREAIRRLEAEGLVEDSGSGAVAVTLGSDALAEMCEVREALEALASRLAALGRSELVILTLEDLTERWRMALETGAGHDQLVQLNNAFHETIWQASGNRYLVEQLKLLRARIELSGPTTLLSETRQNEALKEHHEVLAAIKARDGDTAADSAATHFRKAMAIRVSAARFDRPQGPTE